MIKCGKAGDVLKLTVNEKVEFSLKEYKPHLIIAICGEESICILVIWRREVKLKECLTTL